VVTFSVSSYFLRKKDPWLLTLVSLVFDIGEIIHSNDLFNNTDSFRNKSLALHVSRDMFLDSALTLFQIWIKMFFWSFKMEFGKLQAHSLRKVMAHIS